MWRWIVPVALVALVAMPIVGSAEVLISPEEKRLIKEAEDRALEGDYDMADPYCAGKSVGEPCLRLGNPFEGGGPGICRTSIGTIYDVNGIRSRVTAICMVEKSYILESGSLSSEYAWKLPEAMCEADPAVRIGEAGCKDGVAPDRFCRGKSSGEACTVELVAEGETHPDTFPGVCTPGRITNHVSLDGNLVTITADILNCQTPNIKWPKEEKSSPPRQ